jgi:preprotein translocase subunit SecG
MASMGSGASIGSELQYFNQRSWEQGVADFLQRFRNYVAGIYAAEQLNLCRNQQRREMKPRSGEIYAKASLNQWF